MLKELVICIIIIILIFAGNIITLKYTNSSVDITSKELSELRMEMIKEDVNSEISNQKVNEIYNEWNKRHKKLAYYIEHDELEKVETNLSELKGCVEVQEYKDAIIGIDKTVYVLEHIKNKNIVSLENIF